ncbi:glycosyl hydrolase family 28 protein [Arenibacter sp. F26102]|uniref:glycoside hydrolase family 28 protein n=1 Tax=Arenibacter sp. F26102 TaxID=2926416 RepID=UPI001FF1478E|nr:glycosyl hydrolase family 28 protein [Arenibacter sp. F26102]MCK0146017.1 glycosyl hydrolase family 28 protein [Arenibacter sp. F26102]
MKKGKNYLFVLVLLLVVTNIQARDFNILDFGAKQESMNNAPAIQAAIDSCTSNGGGRVVIPAGNFVTGTLIMKDNVELHVSNGAVLLGSKNIEHYPDIKPEYASLRTSGYVKQLIYAENVKNIKISGFGEIDGQGRGFKRVGNDEGVNRPHMIQFISCYNVGVYDVSLKNSGAWMQHYLACEEVQIRGIKIFNHNNYNNDGLDIDGCKNVTISDIISDTDDDGITLKSASGRPCENISITNSVVSSHCNAIKMGTESNGGFRNISISNCVVKPSAVTDSTFYGQKIGISGLALEIVDGGTMEGVVISGIKIEGTFAPIFIRLGNRARPYQEGMEITNVGKLGDVLISDVHISNAKNIACSITGLPDNPVQNIILNNIVLKHEGGGVLADFNNEIPEKEKDYPEGTMFGILPAHGFFIRHAKNITLKSIQIETQAEDLRPAFILEDVSGGQFSDIQLLNKGKSVAGFALKDSEHILVKNSFYNSDSDSFVKMMGGKLSGISILNNVLYQSKSIFSEKQRSKSIIEQGNVFLKR